MSPSDSAAEIEIKVSQYLRYGALQVWVLYPRTKDIHVFRSDSSATILRASQTLEGGSVLPGFSVPVGELFAV